MRLLKPAWVSHDGHPIFSVDIHPDGSRFATGGQGEDCGRVVVWNMSPVMSDEAEQDENTPKLLCQMDNHLACVNSVRWSMSGRYLASGGDDKAILVWQCSGAGGAVFGGIGGAESWRCVSTLRAHSGDVLDLAWAPHDAWLASCSVDNTVIVWNALNMPEVIAVLKGHTGLVKGVTWDPVGKFLASQSDDKTLRVWRTSDWREESLITEPFDECGGTTHVLRLSWSPDGQYLVSAHAMNGGGPTAQIIEREGWSTDKDFVGHRKAITCVRFNSNILLKTMPHSTKSQQYCCCAIGSRDRALSVWLTALKRPLVIVQDLFKSSVLDLSWSVGGLQLMACSWDGTVAYIEFTEDEIGKPLTASEKKSLHERMYGKSLIAPNTLASATIVETPELLGMRKAQQFQSPVKAAANRTPIPQQQKTSPMKGPIDKQIETRTSDGKRRITPMYIPPNPDTGDAPLPFGSISTQPTFSSTSESSSRIVIERHDDIVVTPNVSSVLHKTNSNDASSSRHVTEVETSKPVTNGVSSNSMDESRPATDISKSMGKDRPSSPGKRASESKSSGRQSKRGRPSAASIAERGDKDRAIPSATNVQQVQAPSSTVVSTRMIEKTVSVCAAVEGELRLPALSIDKTITIQVLGCPGKVLEVENCALASPHGPLHRLKCHFKDRKPPHSQGSNWEAVLGCKAVAIAANASLSLACCEDRVLHVFETLHGRRPLPPLQLCAKPHRLVASRTHVLSLSTQGRVSVWDVATKKALVTEESIAPLLSDKPASVTNCLVTENGSPTIILSSGKAYVYSPTLRTWLLMGDGRDPVQQTSTHLLYATAARNSGISYVPAPPLCALQTHTKSVSSRVSGLPCASTSSCTLSFLEQQLASSRALESARDYHLWLSAFSRFLVHEGMEARLRLLCDELLGPAHGRASMSKAWDSKVMGLSKHILLKEILTVIASNLSLQRLYSEYSDQLDDIESKELTNQIKSPSTTIKISTTPITVKPIPMSSTTAQNCVTSESIAIKEPEKISEDKPEALINDTTKPTDNSTNEKDDVSNHKVNIDKPNEVNLVAEQKDVSEVQNSESIIEEAMEVEISVETSESKEIK